MEKERSWDSTCGDCRRFGDDWCDAHRQPADEEDCIAAICREFEAREKQNYILEAVE